MKTPPYTPSSPDVSGQPYCGHSAADLLDPGLLALDGAGGDGDTALGRATSDRLEQYISEMLRRPDVGDQVRGDERVGEREGG